MRRELERASQDLGRMAPPPQTAPRRIAEGIAERFPDVLLPPQPAPRPPARRPAAVMTPKAIPVPRPVARQQSKKPARRRAAQAPPVLELETAPMRRPDPAGVQPPAPLIPASATSTVQAADAASIARWLKPSTLHQQFILTEVLQPPVALRQHHLGDAG
jgi:hypothetical protein